MTNRTTYIIAALMLTFMLVLGFFSVLGDSMTMDEVAHLPSGYSYITQLDMRLNPEHPPLMKDLSGIGVWLWSKITDTQINFPSDIKAWQEDVNGQWDFGFNFMYESGNDADSMLLAGRIPMFLILLLLGIYVFKWARELFGNQAALLALFFFALSPTFIAHGSLVTTDVAAAAAFFIALYYFVKWLQNPGLKNLLISGVVLGLSLSAKFSVFLLIPLFGFLIIIFSLIKDSLTFSEKIKLLTKNVVQFAAMGVLALLTIYLIYIPHVWNYPMERQISDMSVILKTYANGPDQTPFDSCRDLSRIKRCPAEITIWMASTPVLRPLAQYFYGLLMVIQRAAGGNTTYFLGEVSNSGWASYFPTVYLLKEPLPMHILTLIALLCAIYSTIRKGFGNIFGRLKNWLYEHVAEFSMISFIFLYWYSSITSPLNIGVRHVLPTFPFIYILVSNQIAKWLEVKSQSETQILGEKFKMFWQIFKRKILKFGLVSILLIWQLISVLAVYPHYITYFNELAGGPDNGHKYAVDSNLDWGQDFKRLSKWVNERGMNEIYVDYFGGTRGEYYLGDKLKPWYGEKDFSLMPPDSYLAVSATFQQQCFGTPVENFKPLDCYQWLKDYEPVIIIGNSIFVYHIP